MPPQAHISAVVPVHNEAGFFETALPALVAAMESTGHDFEIIIAENGSSDATGDLAAKAAARDSRIAVIRLPDPDYGAAMREGFVAAAGAWVANFDIDYFSGEFVTAALDKEADVVLASKRAEGADDRRSIYRRLGTWGFNLVLRLLFGSRVSDTHGMKLIRREVVTDLVPQVLSTQDLFDTELVLRAERAGYSIAEVPAVVEEMRAARSSFVKRIPRTLAGLWRVRRRMRAKRRSGS